MKTRKKIVIATGTRADWGLLMPLASELRRQGSEPIVAATYAHLFPEMGDTINEIKADGFTPVEIKARMKNVEAVADTATGFADFFHKEKPDYVVILGDRFEMLGVATAALLTGTRIAHIAGGTVSLGAFDDSIRHSISKMSTLHFPETKRCRDRLVMMGEDQEKVTISGALGVYNALNEKLLSEAELSESLGFDLGEEFILGTFHPATLSEVSAEQQMRIWIEGMERVLRKREGLKYLLTYPNSDTDPRDLIAAMEEFRVRHPERVYLHPSLGRVRYLSAARKAQAVIGNSSSGIVEIPSLNTPVLDIGVRQKGRERSKAVVHSELDSTKISEAIDRVLSEETRRKAAEEINPYYKENTPGIISEKILKEL